MSPVDRAGPVSEISLHHLILCKIFDVFDVSQIWRQNSYPGSLTFSRLGNRAEISHMKPRQN